MGVQAGIDVQTVLLIYGMRSHEERARVEAGLSAVEGVEEVYVSLYRATAIVRHQVECTVERLAEAIVRAGFLAEVRLRGGSEGKE